MSPTTSTAFVSTPTGEALFAVQNLTGSVYSLVKDSKLSGDMKIELKGYEYSDTVAKGQILSQTPAAGEKVDRGTVISVVISAGSSTGVMPDLTGWKEEHAKLYLEALGYRVAESLRLQVSSLDKGLVERSSPKAGAEITLGDTVTLYVSDVSETTAE